MYNELTVLDLKIDKLIKNKAKNIFGIAMDRSDIEQELRTAIIVYCNNTPLEKRTLQAIAVTINQKLYKLIREHSQFEGCSERSKIVRQMLNQPYSLNQPIRQESDDDNDEITLLGSLKSDVDTQADKIMIEDFIKYFRSNLTQTECIIFDLMLDRVNEPRFICKELYGHHRLKMRKIISKHIACIRTKFKETWRQNYGKIVNFKRRS